MRAQHAGWLNTGVNRGGEGRGRRSYVPGLRPWAQQPRNDIKVREGGGRGVTIQLSRANFWNTRRRRARCGVRGGGVVSEVRRSVAWHLLLLLLLLQQTLFLFLFIMALYWLCSYGSQQLHVGWGGCLACSQVVSLPGGRPDTARRSSYVLCNSLQLQLHITSSWRSG